MATVIGTTANGTITGGIIQQKFTVDGASSSLVVTNGTEGAFNDIKPAITKLADGGLAVALEGLSPSVAFRASDRRTYRIQMPQGGQFLLNPGVQNASAPIRATQKTGAL